jgi:hypothetical protein
VQRVPFTDQRLIVDEETGFPLYVRQTTAGGALWSELKVEEITEAAVTDADLAPTQVLDREPEGESLGFTTTTISRVLAHVGYEPLVPKWAPEGYQLASVKVAREVGGRYRDQLNPTSRDVVSLHYRKGFDSFTVTTRRNGHAIGDDATSWTDPVADGSFVQYLNTEMAELERGPLAGVPVHVGVYPLGWPHIWAQTRDLVVTVSGDLTRAQLLKIASSLEEHTPDSE